MFIPIVKSRQVECKVMEEMNYCYSEEIIPLFEIVNEKYQKRYKTDENGKYITEAVKCKGGKIQNRRIPLEETPEDIITLDKINDIVNNKSVFIDYFRYNPSKYKKNLDISKIKLSYILNNNVDKYVNKLKLISKEHKNMIPVLSLKEPFSAQMTIDEVIDIIRELKILNEKIAIRMEDKLFEDYKEILESELREIDFFMYDISEQNFASKMFEFYDVKESAIKAKKILLNSPRLLKNENNVYENRAITCLIDNQALKDYSLYEFDGVGDYCGLKDTLPLTSDGDSQKGASVALLYNYSNNAFYSFCNPDVKKGQDGYIDVIKDVLDYREVLDSDNTCVAYKEIEEMYDGGKFRSWKKWNGIILKRYIDQIFKYF